jgi:hypothetical protein
MDAATKSYVDTVLKFRPDERAVLGAPMRRSTD